MGVGETSRTWQRWILPFAVVIGVGPWGGLAGGAVFALVALALGAPRSMESWAIWFALVGFTLGYGVTSYVAYRVVRRSPRVAGGAAVLIAVVVAISIAADSSGWDWLYLFVPGAVLGAVLVITRRRRAGTSESRSVV